MVDSNVYWPRTVEGNYAIVPCPGVNKIPRNQELTTNSSDVAYRLCARNPNQPFWDKEIAFHKCRLPYFEQLLSELKKALHRQTQQFHQTLVADLQQTGLAFINRFLNFTENSMGSITSPADVAAMIEILGVICRLQEYAVKRVSAFDRRPLAYPTFEDTIEFGERFTEAVELIVGPQCDQAWNLVQPLGAEANNLYRLLDQFTQLCVDSFQSHVRNREASLSQSVLRVIRPGIVVKIKLFRWSDFRGFAMPDVVDSQEFGVDDLEGKLLLPRESVESLNLTSIDRDKDTLFGISSVRFDNIGKYLPNHNVVIQSKWNNINSAVLTFKMHGSGVEPYANFTIPFVVKLKYTKDFNISSPHCVRLLRKDMARDIGNEWAWAKSGCTLKEATTTYATCLCHNQGHFALTTNMFDPDVRKCFPQNLTFLTPFFFFNFYFSGTENKSLLLCSTQDHTWD